MDNRLFLLEMGDFQGFYWSRLRVHEPTVLSKSGLQALESLLSNRSVTASCLTSVMGALKEALQQQGEDGSGSVPSVSVLALSADILTVVFAPQRLRRWTCLCCSCALRS